MRRPQSQQFPHPGPLVPTYIPRRSALRAKAVFRKVTLQSTASGVQHILGTGGRPQYCGRPRSMGEVKAPTPASHPPTPRHQKNPRGRTSCLPSARTFVGFAAERVALSCHTAHRLGPSRPRLEASWSKLHSQIVQSFSRKPRRRRLGAGLSNRVNPLPHAASVQHSFVILPSLFQVTATKPAGLSPQQPRRMPENPNRPMFLRHKPTTGLVGGRARS